VLLWIGVTPLQDPEVGNESMQGYDAMLAAMKGHVLASGEIIGLGSAPAK
jgi:hypothetical protein